jgi:hypothetical protein
MKHFLSWFCLTVFGIILSTDYLARSVFEILACSLYKIKEKVYYKDEINFNKTIVLQQIFPYGIKSRLKRWKQLWWQLHNYFFIF